MKKALAISLVFTVLLASMSKVSIYFAFKVNQSEIVKNLCINRNTPEKHCNGKCILTERLTENESSESVPSHSMQFEETVKINFYHSTSDSDEKGLATLKAVDNFSLKTIHSQPHFSCLLRPPEFA